MVLSCLWQFYAFLLCRDLQALEHPVARAARLTSWREQTTARAWSAWGASA